MRKKLGGANLEILAASYGISDSENPRPRFQSSSQTGSMGPQRLIDLTSQMRKQYEQNGFVVLSGLDCCSFPDPAPLRRKSLTVIYEGTNEYEDQTGHFWMLNVACAGLFATSFALSFVHSSWPMELVTTTAAATGSGMIGVAAGGLCNQARSQGSECYICWDNVCARYDEASKQDHGLPFGLACGHFYHSGCIALWDCRKHGCPLCRAIC